MNISVLGCGRWGTFIAWYLDKVDHNVLLWGRDASQNFLELKNSRKNKYLALESSVKLSADLNKAVDSADVIIISISCQALRSFMEKLNSKSLKNKTIVLCMKGIEKASGKTLTQVVSEFIDDSTNVAIWVGPGHVEDFVKGIPNCMVIDSKNEKIKKSLVESFSSDLIRFYYGSDLIGNEIGSAAKNVIGIAAGMLDGFSYESLKGALMARGTREIARLIKAMGGNEMSAYGLCHLGDYQATLFSPHSHNRKFGELFVKGESFQELAEGVATTEALIKLGEKYSVDLPICKAINKIIKDKEDPKKVLSSLFMRSIKTEF